MGTLAATVSLIGDDAIGKARRAVAEALLLDSVGGV